MRTRIKVCCISSPEEAALAVAAEAAARVRPFGLDVCSGVRTGGRLDPLKLAAFIEAARS